MRKWLKKYQKRWINNNKSVDWLTVAVSDSFILIYTINLCTDI